MYDTLRNDVHFESKGFIPAVSITDFPIRDHKVILLLRRRKWVDIRTGKSFILPLKIAAEGTRYSKEFAAFLKETYGHIPGVNIGPNLAIDETSLSNGDLYTIVTNRDRHGREMCLVAIVAGTKSETVIAALRHIPEHLLDSVEEVTLDLSDSMRKIVRSCFRKASRVIDRFHIQKLACDAVQEMRIIKERTVGKKPLSAV